MSDFLSPAINERIKEKNMSLKEKLMDKYMGIAKAFYYEGSEEESEREVYAPEFATDVIQLFIDTIEKAKPKNSKISSKYSTSVVDRIAFDSAFDIGAETYYQSLLKEIKK